MRFGAAVTAVVLASAIGTLPAAVRVAPTVASTAGPASVWIACMAIVLLPMAFATMVLRQAHAALRLFDLAAIPNGLTVGFVWGVGTFGALSALGAFLRANTHHHGLAGATFAGVGLAIALVVALFAARLVGWADSLGPAVLWIVRAASGIGVGVALASASRTLAGSPAASTWCADILALMLAAAFGALAFPARRRPVTALAVIGPPLAAIVLVMGFAALGDHGADTPPLRATLQEEAPVIASGYALVVPKRPALRPH